MVSSHPRGWRLDSLFSFHLRIQVSSGHVLVILPDKVRTYSMAPRGVTPPPPQTSWFSTCQQIWSWGCELPCSHSLLSPPARWISDQSPLVSISRWALMWVDCRLSQIMPLTLRSPSIQKNDCKDGLLCLFTWSHLVITAHCSRFYDPYLINEETKVHRS